jgi:hypothetical protein
MWGPEGLPRDENERAALCVELLYFANEAGIPNEKIWVDGIVNFNGSKPLRRSGCLYFLRRHI